jgi:hypothetical protein
VRQKHLTVFKIRKPACQLSAAFVLPIIMYSDVWSLVETECWSVQHCISALELFIKTQSVTATQNGFWQQFQRHDAPSYNTLSLWVSKWHQEVSVKDSKPQGHPLSTRTPDSVKWVRDATLWSPHKSARQQPLTLRWNECSVHQILHMDLHYHPYKTQAAQEFSEQGKVSQLVLQWILGLGKKTTETRNITNVRWSSLPCIWLCE